MCVCVFRLFPFSVPLSSHSNEKTMSASFQVLRFAVSLSNPQLPMLSSFPVNLVTASPSVSIVAVKQMIMDVVFYL